MTSWLKVSSANVVLIIDDASASNTFLKRVLLAAAPKELKVYVMTHTDAAVYLKEVSEPGEKIFIITKVPKPLLQIIKEGVILHEIILGNMGGAEGRKMFSRNISASPEEIQDMREIINCGVSIYCQMIPADSKENIKGLL